MATPGPVYLMAGAGPGTGPKSVRYHKDAVAFTGKKKPRIGYIGAAHGDTSTLEKIFGPLIFGLGADVHAIKLTKKALKTSEAKAKLAESDIIFVSGGDVDEGMKAVHDRDLAPYFRELHQAGKVFEGVSAGSIMLGMHWVRFDEKDPAVAEPFDCLGVAPFSFDAHGEKDDWEELQALARALAAKPKPPPNVYGLVSGSCGLWDGTNLQALGGPLHRYTVAPKPVRGDDLLPASTKSSK